VTRTVYVHLGMAVQNRAGRRDKETDLCPAPAAPSPWILYQVQQCLVSVHSFSVRGSANASVAKVLFNV